MRGARRPSPATPLEGQLFDLVFLERCQDSGELPVHGWIYRVATYRHICDISACASSRDALRADLDLRAYGPCHRRDCTAGTPKLLPQIMQPGLGTTSDEFGPAATCRSMDLAAAAGARATRMSRLWAGNAAGGRGPDRLRAGPMTTRPPGAGLRVSPEHGTRRAWQVNSTRHALGIYYSG